MQGESGRMDQVSVCVEEHYTKGNDVEAQLGQLCFFSLVKGRLIAHLRADFLVVVLLK